MVLVWRLDSTTDRTVVIFGTEGGGRLAAATKSLRNLPSPDRVKVFPSTPTSSTFTARPTSLISGTLRQAPARDSEREANPVGQVGEDWVEPSELVDGVAEGD